MGDFIKKLYHRLVIHEVTAVSAQLTYYLLLAFFPFVAIIISLLSYTPWTSEFLLNNLNQMFNLDQLLPNSAYSTVQTIIWEVEKTRNQTLLSIGMVIALWSASNGVNSAIKGVNKAYAEKETRSFWRLRLISVIFTLFLALALLSAFVLLVFGQLLGQFLEPYLGTLVFFNLTWQILRYLVALVFIFLVFLVFYKYSPNYHSRLCHVVPGAIFATLGWVLSSLIFSFYVNNFVNFSLIYGSLGGIFVLLIWLYISSIVILMGAEINAVLTLVQE